MSKSAPAPPDYGAAAQAQADSSREVTEQQTWANRPTINTPFGQQTWEVTPNWDPSTGQYLNSWTQNTNLTPEAQAALDAQMGLQQGRSELAGSLLGRAQEEYGDTMDWNQFQGLAESPDVPQYGGNLPAFGQSPEVPNYGTGSFSQFAQAPQGQSYSPESIQRGLDLQGMQGVDPSSRYYNEAGDAIFNQWASRNEPRFERDQAALRTQLYNQGIKEGDRAYDEEMRKLREGQTDARNQATYQATIGAGQEAQRMYGMDLGTRQQQFDERSGAGQFANQAADQALQQQLGIGGQRFAEQLQGGQFTDAQRAQQVQEMLGIGGQQFNQQQANAQRQDAQRAAVGQEQLAFGQQGFNQQMQQANYQNQLRQQQIAEEMQQRGFSLNEINAIISGQQVGMPSMPSFNTANRSEGVQSLQAAQMQGQAALDSFNAEQQAMQGMMSGIAGGAMMFSDRRLKTDIIKVGKFKKHNLYVWHWIYGGAGVGVMADEVPADCVATDPQSGYLMVDYGRI